MSRRCGRWADTVASRTQGVGMDLQGKVAFVTGGSGDIGSAICGALASAGCDVALSYVGNAEGAEKAAGEVRAAGRQAYEVQLDQRDAMSIDAAAQAVVSRFGRCDVLVNN